MIKLFTHFIKKFQKSSNLSSIICRSRMHFTTQKYQPHPIIANLQKQIKYETQNAPDYTQKKQILQKSGWNQQIIGTLIQLTKQIDQKTVHIVYFSRFPIQEYKSNSQKKIPEQFEFTIYIKKQSFQHYLYADFLIIQGDIKLTELNFTNNYYAHRILNKGLRDRHKYKGPDINSLDEALINHLHTYFLQLGLTDDLLSYIEFNSAVVEHSSYVNWLNDVKNYIQL